MGVLFLLLRSGIVLVAEKPPVLEWRQLKLRLARVELQDDVSARPCIIRNMPFS